jgi:cobalt-zinc-cadmium efflux system outer membrane protein
MPESGTRRGGSLPRHLWLVLILIGAGCARFDARPILPDRAAEEFDARSFDDPGLAGYLAENGIPPAGIGDPWDMERLTLAAFYFSHEMDLARARVKTAEAERFEAGLRADPSISLAPGYDTTTPPPWIWTVDLTIPVLTASKRGYRMAEADHLTEASRWDLAGAAWTVRDRLRRALIAYAAASESLRLQQDLEDLLGEVEARTEQRVATGEDALVRLAEVRIEQQTRRLDRVEAEREVLAAQAAVASAIGVPQKALTGIRIRFEDLDRVPQGLTPAVVRRAAALNRTDVRSALAVYAASQSALQLEIARQYPDVDIGPGYQLDQTDDKWTLGLSFTLPLVNRNRGGIAVARARREEAAAVFDIVQTEALNEVDRALASFEAARREETAADSLTIVLEQGRRSVEARAEAGDVGPLDVLIARIQYDLGALARVSAVRNVQQSLGDLESAVQLPLAGSGIPWPDVRPAIPPPGNPGIDHE